MSHDHNILCVLIYVVILCVMLLKHQHSTQCRWGAGSWILFSYIIYPIIGAFWYFNPNTPYDDHITTLTLFPFIYLSIMLLIALRPVMQFDREDIKRITPPPMQILNIFTVIFIICTLLQIPSIVEDLIHGILSIILDNTMGTELYAESQVYETQYDGHISNIFGIIFNIFSPLAFILFFYYLTLEKKYNWAKIGYGICILIKCFSSLSNGQRTEVTMSLLNILVAYLIMRPMLPKRIHRVTKRMLIVLSISVAIPFIALSLSRFGEREGGMLGSIIYYIGEAPYYFNQFALDAGETRHGDRTCNVFKQLMGMHTYKGIFGVRDAYPSIKMNDSIFSTFVGDFVLDFGPWITAILFILFSKVFTLLTRSTTENELPFHRMILLYFAMTVCMQGGFYLFDYSFEKNLQIIAVFIFYLIFAFFYNNQSQKGGLHE